MDSAPVSSAARPRVLLADDDASMRKLVAMVLEVLDIELLVCANGAQALDALRAAPVQLLITDLMMPGVSGYDLLQALAETPALRGPARVVVFSAGLDAAARARLAPWGVWQVLGKPVSVKALEDCVRSALALDAAEETAGDGAAADAPASADSPDEGFEEQAAVARYFAGQTALFEAYRADCLLQFGNDLEAGSLAMAAHDAPALRRLAHNLKSVLRMLGRDAAAAQAQTLEDAAARADWTGVAEGWRGLSRPLRRWAKPASASAPG